MVDEPNRSTADAADAADADGTAESGGDVDRRQAAELRDQAGRRRDLSAHERDQAAQQRDLSADRQDDQADDTTTDAADAASGRARSRRDRDAAAEDRTEAQLDRTAAAQDRSAAARDRHAASVDPLTGVYGREAGLMELHRDLARAARRSAQDVGVRSFLAVPLHVAGHPVGVLNLYSASNAVPEPDPDYVTVLTEYAGRGLTDYQAHQPGAVTGTALRIALTQWTVVEQAVGVLMQRYGFTADYAMNVLSDQARDWNRTRPEQATHIIAEHIPPS